MGMPHLTTHQVVQFWYTSYASITFYKNVISGCCVQNIQGDRTEEGNQLGGYCNNLVRKVVVWIMLEAMEGGEVVKIKTGGKGGMLMEQMRGREKAPGCWCAHPGEFQCHINETGKTAREGG